MYHNDTDKTQGKVLMNANVIEEDNPHWEYAVFDHLAEFNSTTYIDQLPIG